MLLTRENKSVNMPIFKCQCIILNGQNMCAILLTEYWHTKNSLGMLAVIIIYLGEIKYE